VQVLSAIQGLCKLKVGLVQLVLVDLQDLNDEQLTPLAEGMGVGLVNVLLTHCRPHLPQHLHDLRGLQNRERVHLLRLRNGLGQVFPTKASTTTH
jgi:hypothetical protein